MKIGQLAELAEVSSKTIRYYEDVGLLPVAARTVSGYREYNKVALEQLIFIRRCRELQIPLQQIKQLNRVQTDKSASCHEIDQIIAEQLAKVRKTRQELSALEKSLSALAKSCQQDRIDDCEILHRLNTPPTDC